MQTNETDYDAAYNAIAPIVLKNRNHPDFPFFTGTGFFVQFPPFENIFFVTAKHCVLNDKNPIDDTVFQIPYVSKGYVSKGYVSKGAEAVHFSEYFTTQTSDDLDEDDILIYVVSDDISAEQKNLLRNRALRLQHQDDVDDTVGFIIKFNENVRAIGFPSVSKSIDYKNNEATTQARLFYGKISKSKSKNVFNIENLNWGDKGAENGLDGFSGSPVFALIPNLINTNEIITFVLGVLITGSKEKARFISINVVTDLVAEFIKKYVLKQQSV